MNLMLLREEDRVVGSQNRYTLPREMAHHMRTVLHASRGDTLRVGCLNGPAGTARVLDVHTGLLEVERWEPVSPPRRLELWLALPRPKVLRRVLRDATTLGVTHFVLLRAARVDKSYLSDALLRDPATFARSALHEGLMQARLTFEPEVRVEPRFRPFVEDHARAALATAGGSGVLCHPPDERTPHLAEHLARRGADVVAIGPEGGWVPFEVEQWVSAGLSPAALGNAILRVETATTAALALIQAARRDDAPAP
jgi:RsmE family RNA methyltransferase